MRFIRLIAFLLPGLLSLPTQSFAKNKLDGDWEGALQGGKLPMIFHIRLAGGSSVDSPQQGIHGMPTFVSMSGKTVQISMPGGAATFEGELTGPEIIGTYRQTGSQWPMTLKKASKKH